MSLLMTDGYKFSMAEAGWPLRRETFYYAHRRGGPAFLPFDVKAELSKLVPEPTAEDYEYLAAHEYEMGAGFKAAMTPAPGTTLASVLTVEALPRGSWFLPGEPAFSVTGPSALVSWLEPLALALNYRIQIATLAKTDPTELAREVATVTCEAQRDIVRKTLDAVSVPAPPIAVDSEGYLARVKACADELVGIVGDPARIFEVGLRAATSVDQHRLALEACRAAGIARTSHVWAARELGMIPVGTMGHEHVQRFFSDEAAFRAMRDRRPGRSSYLLDTFDTIRSGIPAAFRVMQEDPSRGDSIRYDSGDKESQYRFAAEEAKRRGLQPIQILEDGFDAVQTRRFEVLRHEVGWGEDRQFYGYGGYLVARTSGSSLLRDRVAAVYKLCESAGAPTMKFGDERGAGKESVPGQPVVFRRVAGDGPVGLIGQRGEAPPAGYVLASGAERPEGWGPAEGGLAAPSERTKALVAEVRARAAAHRAGGA